MPTYVVGDIHITDPAAYQAHVPRALATIARFGGRVIAGGGKIDLLEGDPMPERVFIIEFPSAAAARRWYQSDDHQQALQVRLSASRGRVFLIEGNEISTADPVSGLDAGKGERVPWASLAVSWLQGETDEDLCVGQPGLLTETRAKMARCLDAVLLGRRGGDGGGGSRPRLALNRNAALAWLARVFVAAVIKTG